MTLHRFGLDTESRGSFAGFDGSGPFHGNVSQRSLIALADDGGSSHRSRYLASMVNVGTDGAYATQSADLHRTLGPVHYSNDLGDHEYRAVREHAGSLRSEVAGPKPNGTVQPTDGVYVGFQPSIVKGDPATHVFLWIQTWGGNAGATESGPKYLSGQSGTLPKNATNMNYGSNPSTATYGYVKVTPPAGESNLQFALAIADENQNYDAVQIEQPNSIPSYSILPGGLNCENYASGLLTAAGVPASELQSIVKHTTGVDPYFTKPYALGNIIMQGAPLVGDNVMPPVSSSNGGVGQQIVTFTPNTNVSVHVWFNGVCYS